VLTLPGRRQLILLQKRRRCPCDHRGPQPDFARQRPEGV